jgi:hypothetical protein
LVGNVFLPEKIDAAIALGREFDIYRQILEHPSELSLLLKTQYYIGVDPAFGSSKFGIVMVCMIDGKLCVLESIELDRQDFNYCINKVTEIMYKYGLLTTAVVWLTVLHGQNLSYGTIGAFNYPSSARATVFHPGGGQFTVPLRNRNEPRWENESIHIVDRPIPNGVPRLDGGIMGVQITRLKQP